MRAHAARRGEEREQERRRVPSSGGRGGRGGGVWGCGGGGGGAHRLASCLVEEDLHALQLPLGLGLRRLRRLRHLLRLRAAREAPRHETQGILQNSTLKRVDSLLPQRCDQADATKSGDSR